MAAAAKGRWAEAETYFSRLCLREGTARAFHDLGVARLHQGRVAEAAQAHWNAAVRAPESAVHALSFGQLFRQLRFDAHDPELERMACFCLTHPHLNPAPYRAVAGSIVACHPTIQPWIGSREAVDSDSLLALAEIPLLQALLENSVPPSLEFEDLVRRLRRTLLQHASAGGAASVLVDLAVAVAIQGHLTNYVALPWDDEEGPLRDSVRTRAEERLRSGVRPDSGELTFELAVLGAYEPLVNIEGLPGPELDPDDPEGPFSRLWLRLVVEPALRAALAESVPRHSGPGGGVTAAVARQYEEHPYPRWLRHDRAVAAPARAAVAAAAWGFPDVTVTSAALSPGGRPDVLIAGCGTGKQALDAVQRYEHARVVALDLSRASLGYAAAAALQVGTEAVEFLQADIMALEGWEPRFDIIESGGVLHHLVDPVAGWRILRGLLAPGGLMRVAVYSRLAREPLDRAREKLAGAGFGGEPGAIRAGRRWLVSELAEADRTLIASWRDFYSLDECRDLLFHAHERCFDLDGLAEVMGSLNLTFLGFEGLTTAAKRRFDLRFGEGRRRDLSAWRAFEEEHPQMFAGMYHFWVARGEDQPAVG